MCPDAPKSPSVTLNSSAEIMEGLSVRLTCSSDANPAAKHTWYKLNRKMLQGRIYDFPSISSEDRGHYCCQAENLYGQINSSYQFIDVQCKFHFIVTPRSDWPSELGGSVVIGRILFVINTLNTLESQSCWPDESVLHLRFGETFANHRKKKLNNIDIDILSTQHVFYKFH